MTGRCKGCGKFGPLLRLGEALVCESCAHGGRVDRDSSCDVVLLINGRSLRIAATTGKGPTECADIMTRYQVLAKFAKTTAE
jgi:hypothetical protein